MKRSVGSLVAGIFAIQLLPGGAFAAGCATGADTAALKIAALQQELMVAAFSCRDVARYNDFVLAHRPELVASDANLKAFFVRQDASRGEAAYHTYKTELANSASLNSLRDDGFCATADDEFDTANGGSSLSQFVAEMRWPMAATYSACRGTMEPLQTASIEPPRVTWNPRREQATNRTDNGPENGRRTGSRSSPDGTGVAGPAPHRTIQDDAGN